MGKVVKLPNLMTRHDISAPSMLREIAKEKPKHCFVICWPEDGSMPTYHSTTSDMPTVLMRLREFEHKYFDGDFT
jgi:hypothetical protein